MDTLEDLFQKFVKLAVSLLDDTETWTIQLPSQFLIALSSKIRKKITTSTFIMPKQSALSMKHDQINGTRLVKNEASSIFNEIEERKHELQEQISIMAKTAQPKHQAKALVGAAYTSTSLAEANFYKI